MRRILQVVGSVWWVICFVWGFVRYGVPEFFRSFWQSFRWSFRAGYVLVERKALTGQEYDRQDINQLAQRMREDDLQLQEHRRKYGR